jgi:O-antigen biosynthesis protein WbqP
MKRAFDLLAASAGLVVASPIFLACVLAVRLSSPGPAVFRQTRVGQGERPFTCYKLRTMYLDTGDRPSHEVGASSVTPVGKWLRRLKLDEIPQLWNVATGEMSLVGPRPCLPKQVELVEARRRRGVYALRPGITGLAQVQGVDMSDPERLAALDAEYLRTRSFMGDLKLILATVTGAGQGDRVRA